MTTQTNQEIPHPDPHIIPAETAAPATREGSHFAQIQHDSPADTQHIHTRDGYTVDPEGLINNYAVEPPMYINQPGDLAESEAAIAKQRAADLEVLAEDEEGKLTMTHDWRHKGPGMI